MHKKGNNISATVTKMMRGCFTAAGPGRLVKAEGEIKVKKV